MEDESFLRVRIRSLFFLGCDEFFENKFNGEFIRFVSVFSRLEIVDFNDFEEFFILISLRRFNNF